MNRVILFTPIGGTDPISATNCKDGSMLHICRFYKPDKVVMYMSKEILEFQEQDDRYRYCLNQLGALIHHQMEYEIIERKDLVSVHEFDYYYQDFRSIIQKIYQQMDATDILLLNVSSGTPAMKSGLLVLLTLGEFPAKAIQVATPERKINEHVHKDYDVKLLWELNEDNETEFENRCKEVQCPTLLNIKKEEVIAIGDNMNDELMIKNAGKGVAMGQSNPKIKEIADVVTQDNNNNGVANILNKLI